MLDSLITWPIALQSGNRSMRVKKSMHRVNKHFVQLSNLP